MNPFFAFALVLVSFAGMEFIAWASHKYLMHGILWPMHRDHHQKNRDRFFEFNDLFFPVFALPGILFIYLGYSSGFDTPWLWLGLGISLYGLAYLFVHDIIIHQRVKILRNWDSIYVRAIRRAHKVHHKHLGKEDGENFGFLFVSPKYLEIVRTQKASN
ncbi:MAG: sterol desaturase family protein [Deferribacteres bacterium]|nr:sterol desaturase family protein [candidate division KSB1 bacterium]MCB9504074.1 sterol desaturase family protein [Deferribacteres bacterium]